MAKTLRSGLVIDEPDVYCLIWHRTVYPNPACPPQECTDWYQRARYVRGGKTVSTGWAFWSSDSWTDFAEFKVLDTVTLPLGATPDLAKTSTYQRLVAEREERRAGSDLSGWLSPEGEWHPCPFHSHDLYALYVLRPIPGWSRQGWMKLDSAGYSLDEVSTQAQEDWLREHRQVF